MPEERCVRCGQKVPWVSFAGNLSMTFYKLVVGFLGGSAALIADGIHSFTDVIGTSAIIASRKVSDQPADERHPYGHGKAEYMGSAFVYIILFFLSLGIIGGGIMVMVRHQQSVPSFVTLLGAVVSVLYNVIMYMLGQCAGKRNNSPALLANSFENRADAISSAACILGIAGAILVHPICDPIAAVIVGLVILVNALEQLGESAHGLMDKSLPAEAVRRIEGVAAAHPDVTGVDFVKTRQTGTKYWVDVGIRVKDELDVGDCDDVAAAVRKELLRRSERFEDVAVFVAGERPDGTEEQAHVH